MLPYFQFLVAVQAADLEKQGLPCLDHTDDHLPRSVDIQSRRLQLLDMDSCTDSAQLQDNPIFNIDSQLNRLVDLRATHRSQNL